MDSIPTSVEIDDDEEETVWEPEETARFLEHVYDDPTRTPAPTHR